MFLFLFSFSFLFLFHFLIFLFFFYVKDGKTPLFVAAQEGHEQIVQLLLEKGKPNVDLAKKVILLIFFSSVSFSFIFSFFYLIKNKKIKIGRTPLFIAAQEGSEQIVQLLLEKGKANVNIVTEVLLLI